MQNKKYMMPLLATALLSNALLAMGDVTQILPGLTYNNPAMLFATEHGQLILEGYSVDPNATFTGTTGASAGVVGSANSNHYDFLPDGLFAYRLSPKLVVGLAVTTPNFVDLEYGVGSFVQFTTTKTFDRSTNIAPRFSIQALPNFSLGAGLDIEYAHHIAAFVPSTALGNLYSESHGAHVGFDLGAAYKFKSTIVDFTYYSPRTQELSNGTSTTTSGLWSQAYYTKVYDPAVVSLDVIQFFTKKFLAWGDIYYSNWTRQPSFVFSNTAIGTLTLPLNYYNTWSFMLGGQYNFYQNWNFILGGLYETNFSPKRTNLTGYPASPSLYGTTGLSYQFNKKFSGRFLYTYGAYTPNASITGALGDVGNVKLHLNMFGAQLAYKW